MEIITVVIFILVFLSSYTYWRFKDLPNGPYGLPIIGYTFFLGKKPHETFKKLTKKYGNVFGINLANQPIVVVNDWKTITEVLINKGNTFSNRPQLFPIDYMFENKDIAASEGHVFKEQKRIVIHILKYFGMGKSSLESIVMEEVDKVTKQLQLLNGKPIEITSFFFAPVFNVIWALVGGKNLDPMETKTKVLGTSVKKISKLIDNVNLLSMLPGLRHIMPDFLGFTELKSVKETILKYLHEEVDEHIQNFNENSIKDVIDAYLLEIKKYKSTNKTEAPPFTKDNLVFTIFDLFFGGTDTITSTLSWSILYMAIRPDIQQKVQKELDAVIGENYNLSLTSKALLPYTEATLLEILRISSVVPLSIPHCSAKGTTINGCKIPGGTKIITNLWGIHNDKDYWGDPSNFRPERFLDDNGKIVKHQNFLPFSAGPRICIAESLAKLELHLFFTCLFHRFTFELVPSQPKPSTEPVIGMTMGPHKFSVIVKCR